VREQLVIKLHANVQIRQERLSSRENFVKSAKKTGPTFKDIKTKLTFLLISLIPLISLIAITGVFYKRLTTCSQTQARDFDNALCPARQARAQLPLNEPRPGKPVYNEFVKSINIGLTQLTEIVCNQDRPNTTESHHG
jgi:hypothetical protein